MVFLIVVLYVAIAAAAILASGCTVDRQLVQAEAQAALNAGGCLCVAQECKALLSASGRAAVEGEAAMSARKTHLETKSK